MTARKGIHSLEWLAKRRVPAIVSIVLTYICYSLAVTNSVVATLLQLCDKSTASPESGIYAKLVEFAVDNRLLIYSYMTASLLALVLLKVIAQRLSPACNNVAMRQLLQEAVTAITYDPSNANYPDRSKYRYRSTLFKFREPWWIIRCITKYRWAGVVARSDDSHMHSSAVFLIDDSDPSRSTGLVGLCHKAEGQTICVPLCDPNQDKAKYLQESNIDEDTFKRLKVIPRSCVVVGVKRMGRIWGAIIFDTDDPHPLSSAQRQNVSKRTIRIVSVAVAELIK